MEASEFETLVKGMKSAYTTQNFLPDVESVNIWYSLLKDLDYTTARIAVTKHICNCKFPPTIAEIREACMDVSHEEYHTWLDGWSEVQRLIGRYGYCREKEALGKLREYDPVAESVARRMGWQNLCTSESPSVDRASFRQCYEAMQNREKEYYKLPQTVKNRMDMLTSTFLKGLPT